MNLVNKSTINISKEPEIDYGKYGIRTGSGGIFKYYAILNIISDDDISIRYFDYTKDKKIIGPILKSKLEDEDTTNSDSSDKKEVMI